jgi:quinoprotein glucose dehydrogenase
MNLRCLALPLSLLLTIATSHAVDAEGVTEDRKNAHALKPAERKGDTTPADSAAAAQKGFRRAKIPAGFKADLWAAEPLLANPVAFSFDGKGRMFIAETHRYRTSVLDIRHYMFMLEDDLANRNQADWERSIKKNFPNDWQELGKETEVVRLVEDTDGDGKADKSGVYADGFNSILDGIASGVLARPDGVWVTNIPGLYKLSGQGADGKTEKKEEVFRGFGVRFSYTGHDLHGLIKGPDGRLYFSIGDRGASVKTKESGTIEVPDEGAIFRCEEDGSHLELVMRGLRNPQELAYDDYGNLFTCDNDSDQGDRERLVYVVEGGDAGWRVGYQHCPQPAERNPWLAEHMWEPRDPAKNQPASILSPVANLPDGPGGLVHYPGTGLPEKYNGCFFLACYKGSSATSQVAVFKPVPDGAGFKLELLETFIPGCQATDVDFGPDSRMYVSFWDEGWERTAQGRIMKVEHEEARKAQAAQIGMVQGILSNGMKGMNEVLLTRLLGHPDQRVRLEAQWELAGRDSKTKLYEAYALSAGTAETAKPSRVQRLHSLWVMGQVARRTRTQAKLFETLDTWMEGTEEPDEEVRAQQVKLLADLLGQVPEVPDHVLRSMKKLSADPSPRVRLFAAKALGMAGKQWCVALLLDLARREQDKSQEMRHVISHALFQLALRDPKAWETVRGAAADTDSSVRKVVLQACAKLAEKAATMTNVEPWFQDAAKVVGGFLSDADVSISREAAWLITDRGISAAGDVLSSGKVTATDTMTTLRRINVMFGRAKFAADETHDPALRAEAWRMTLAEMFPNRVDRDHVVGVFRPRPLELPPGIDNTDWQLRPWILKYAPMCLHAPKDVALGALEALRRAKAYGNNNAKFEKEVLELILEAKADVAVRVSALRVLADVGSGVLPEALKKSVSDPSSTVRIAAAGLLGKTDPVAAAKALESALAQGTAEDARAAFVELAVLAGAEADRIVAEQLAALAAGKVPAIAKLELLEAAAKREAPAVKEALGKYEAALPQNDVVAKFAACLEGGDKEAGRKLYNEHPVAACKRCHMINHSGGEAGPALDGIGAKDRRYLLESIIAPNAQIAETFRMVVCNLKDGMVKTGVLRAESADSVTIQPPGEEPETIKTADIATRDAVPSGMMPGLEVLLTKRELRDLVEYLASLKTAPGSAPKSGK